MFLNSFPIDLPGWVTYDLDLYVNPSGDCRILPYKGNHVKKSIRIIITILTILIEIYAAYLGGMHGYYEITNGHKDPGGILFDAISGNSLATYFNGWPGWPAMSIIPDLLITGIVVLVFDGILLVWFIVFINRKKWGIILLCLSVLLCVCGGGFMPPFYAIMAGIIVSITKRIHQKV